MAINSISALGSASGGQMAKSQPIDTVSKGIKDEISLMQRKLQDVSSKEHMSSEEKMKKRQEIQQKISSLNNKLRQHQSEVGKEKRKKILADEMKAESVQKDKKQTDKVSAEEKRTGKVQQEEKRADGVRTDKAGVAKTQTDREKLGRTQPEEKQTGKVQMDGEQDVKTSAEKPAESYGEKADAGLTRRGMRAISTANAAVERADYQGTVVAQIEGGIAILKGEIKQDEFRGENVEYKQTELAKQEDRAMQAAASRYSVLGEARQAMQETTRPQAEEAQVGLKRSHEIEEKGMIGATNYVKKTESDTQQQFFFSSMNIRG